MNKIRLVAAAAVAVAATLLSAGAAQAYPDSPNVTITIPDSVIYGGDTFDYTAKADVTCKWTVTYGQAVNGSKNQTGTGTSISGTYDTKVVSKIYKSNITALCKYDDGVPAVKAKVIIDNDVTPAFYSTDSGSVLQAAAQQASASAVVTLLPRETSGDNTDDNGILPNTGGSSFWILVVAVGLVLSGGGLTFLTRRRNTAH